MRMIRVCGSHEYFWARCGDAGLQLCFTDMMITSRSPRPEVVVFSHDESVGQDIFTQVEREIIKACDIVKRIPRDCVCGIGVRIDETYKVLRMSESELAFKSMSEASSGYTKNSREASTAPPRLPGVFNSGKIKPQKTLKDFGSSEVDENLVHAMCQEIVSSTLIFPDLNHSSRSSMETFHPTFKKPTNVTADSRRQTSKGKVKQNSNKKSVTLCRKIIEELLITLISSKNQENKRTRYNNKGTIINIWTSRCEVSSCEPQVDFVVSVDGLEFRSFLSSEQVESFMIRNQVRCHSVTIFESVKATPSAPRTPSILDNQATQERNLKKRGRPLGWRKDESRIISQTLEVEETQYLAETLEVKETKSVGETPEVRETQSLAETLEVKQTQFLVNSHTSATTSEAPMASIPLSVESTFGPALVSTELTSASDILHDVKTQKRRGRPPGWRKIKKIYCSPESKVTKLRRQDSGSSRENEVPCRKKVKVSLCNDYQEFSDLETMKSLETDDIHCRKKVKVSISKNHQEISDLEAMNTQSETEITLINRAKVSICGVS